MTAGYASMQLFDEECVARLNTLGELARKAIRDAADVVRTPAQITGIGSVFALRFAEQPAYSYRDLLPSPAGQTQLADLHRFYLNNGILMAPLGLFVLSTAMKNDDIEKLHDVTIRALRAGIMHE
jgi:glutamate-1-semialdehyde 2,1-aminomutase